MQEKAFYKRGSGLDAPARARQRSASALEGSWLCGQESSSPDSESGEQWTPFGKVNLVPGGKRTQGAQKPSAVLWGQLMSPGQGYTLADSEGPTISEPQ